MNLTSLKIISFHIGDSACAHCGTAIKNIVVVRDADGAEHHIGTDCATRVGCEPWQIRDRVTDQQRDQNNAEREARDAELREVRRIKLAVRMTKVSHITTGLRAYESDFYTSLANQLESDSLSIRQAYFVAKALYGRRTKANAEQYDATLDLCTTENF